MSKLVPRRCRTSPVATDDARGPPSQGEGDEQGREANVERIKKAATRTIDLRKSITGRAQSPSLSPESRRALSSSKRDKGRDTPGRDLEEGQASGSSTAASRSQRHVDSSQTSPERASASNSSDDSPFVRPPSPPPHLPDRPSLQAIQGVGSMRAGTQTLIQAIQALPWVDDPENDDDLGAATTPNVDSDDDSKGHVASSIHAIYHTWDLLFPDRSAEQRYVQGDETELNMDFEDDVDADDFEATTPRPDDIRKHEVPRPIVAAELNASVRRRAASRTGSMATVKVGRRARLAEKLREIFDIDVLREVWAEMPCWLLRSVLLQGYMYLTNSHICFFAHMPSREVHSGSLSKKATRTKRWIKYWFVLKNDALSWFQSSSDPYFLNGIIDLRYVIACEPKNVLLSADSVPSRDEWVKAVRKNMGDTVKVILDTIEVKVMDKVESSGLLLFRSISMTYKPALDHIRDAVRAHRALAPASPQAVLDTYAPGIDRARSLPTSDTKGATPSRLSLFLRPFHDSLPLPIGRMHSSPEPPNGTEEYMHVSKRDTFIPITTSPQSYSGVELASPATFNSAPSIPANNPTLVRDHTYPPTTPSIESYSVSATGVDSTPTASQSLGGVREIYSPPWQSSSDQPLGAATELGYSVLETAEAKFRAAFAFDDREILLGYFSGYLFRLLPVYGRLYVSSNYFCFKSSGPLTPKTKMILPIRDILNVEKSKATRFGHYWSHQLFFEFGVEDRRTAFVSVLEAKRPSSNDIPKLSQGQARCFDFGRPKESLHFTFLTVGSRGDVQPYIALAKGLIADGHRCKIATHGEFQAWIESHGIEFGYVGGDPAELMRICVENGTFTVSFFKEGLLKFRGWLDDLLKTSWEACQGTDVLVESPSAMGGYHIAEALRIPYFRAFTMTWTRTRAYPHAFAVPERKMGGGYNYMSYVMFDQVFWRAISGQINRWRRNLLHLENTSLDRMEPHKIPFLYNFSPAIVPPPLDWPEWIRVTGYWFLDDAVDLISFIDTAHQAGRKVVYIGFGSIVVSDPKGMTRCIIEAIVQSGVYAILSKGWSDRLHTKASEACEPEEPLPKQIYAIPSIPHDWLFRRIDAACHHGGAGTTGASLRAGIPTIIKPFFGDQFFWADRVEALGIGTSVRKLTVENLKDALKQIDRARLVGEQIRSVS
ncbi:hypothetical protein EDD16DRAFT_1531005 [Pisolithus croceorrhizus]|nr:hypothetical protein EDD16DRAFT_1531005 [Pisolithus croceorrhizus]